MKQVLQRRRFLEALASTGNGWMGWPVKPSLATPLREIRARRGLRISEAAAALPAELLEQRPGKEASMVYAGRWRWWSGGRRWKTEGQWKSGHSRSRSAATGSRRAISQAGRDPGQLPASVRQMPTHRSTNDGWSPAGPRLATPQKWFFVSNGPPVARQFARQ